MGRPPRAAGVDGEGGAVRCGAEGGADGGGGGGGVASGAAMLPRCRRREDGLRAVGRVAPGVTPRTLGFVAAQDRGQVLLLLGELLHLLPERSVHLLQLLALLGTRDTTQRRGLGEWFSNGVLQGALRK